MVSSTGYIIGGAILLFLLLGIRIVNQYQRAVKFRLGKYVKTLQPGFRWIIPVVERIEKVDIRVIATDIPAQEVITKDNVPMKVNGVVFFKVVNSEKAILEVEEYKYAISQLAQSALRDMTGKAELDFPIIFPASSSFCAACFSASALIILALLSLSASA